MTRAASFVTMSSILLVSLCLVTACGGGDEQLPESGSAAPTPTPTPTPTPEQSAAPTPEMPDLAAPAVTPPTPEQRTQAAEAIAEQLSETIELPGYYPDDGPLYPGAKPSQAQQTTTGRVSVVFGTDAPPSEASKIMTEASEAKGWSIEAEDEIEQGRLTRASKGDRKLMILTHRMDDASQDAVTLVAVTVDP